MTLAIKFALKHLSSVKKLLLFNFLFLFLCQIFIGFRDLDDYLVIFVFALFLNDLYLKLTRPQLNVDLSEKRKRIWITLFLILLVSLPLCFDLFHVKLVTQSFICKVGLILWAQVFLLDSFIHYRETHSKKWLVFANIAGMFIIFFSVAI